MANIHAQLLARATKPGLDSSFGTPEHRAYFPVGEAFVVAEQEGRLEVVRKRGDRPLQGLDHLHPLQFLAGIGLVRTYLRGRGSGAILSGVERHGRMSAAPSAAVAAQIGKGGKKPGREVGLRVKALAIPIKPYECFRDQVAGIG